MVNETRIKDLMKKSFPECPICGSVSGYDVTSVLKGHVQCKSCLAEWSSPDFVRSTKLTALKLIELPIGVPSPIWKKQPIKRYEYYPVEFWEKIGRTSSKTSHRLFTLKEMRTVLPKVIVIFLLAFLPRFFLIDETSVMTDEPIYVSAGRSYVTGFLTLNFNSGIWGQNAEHPPIAKLLIGLSSDLFIPLLGKENTHNIYFAARIAPVTAGTLLCVAIYFLGRNLYGEKPSLLASLLAALSPWLIYYSTIAILDIFATLFVTLTFIFLSYAETRNRYYVLVGIFLGLAVGSKGIAVAAIPGITIYLLVTKFVLNRTQNETNPRVTWKAIKQTLLAFMIAMFVFFATWPWLWSNTIARVVEVIGFHLSNVLGGHATFYAGQVYTHVPPWVSIYIVFVKSPLSIFVLSILFLFNVTIRLVRREPVQRGQIGVFSWLVGGLLTMSSLNMIVGDHYLIFLCPAVLLSASIFLFDLLEMTGNSQTKLNKAHLALYALFVLMIIESSVGLVTHLSSECGYANELVGQSDKAVLMIDTGFKDVADYLIEQAPKNVKVAVAYNVDLLRIELLRKNESRFTLVSLDELKNARYAVFPSIYTQRWGIPAEVQLYWSLVYIVRSDQSVLTYVYKAP
jgi:4-amino-4-deoxy-L-arabinose transferase-like glycosyltransferase